MMLFHTNTVLHHWRDLIWSIVLAFLILFACGLIEGSAQAQEGPKCITLDRAQEIVKGSAFTHWRRVTGLGLQTVNGLWHAIPEHDNDPEWTVAVLLDAPDGGVLLVGHDEMICGYAPMKGDFWRSVREMIEGTPA